MKRCSRCEVAKPRDEFFRNATTKDGYTYACKDCTRSYLAAWHARNPERKKEHARAGYQRNIEERRARAREWQHAWRAANPGVAAERIRRYRERNPGSSAEVSRRYRANNPDYRMRNLEAARARGLKWAREHPDYRRESCRQRRARIRGAEGRTTARQERDRWDVCGQACTYCGVSLPWEHRATWHFDHLIPLSRGGSNWPANLRPACKPCNERKGNKTYFEYVLAADLRG